MTNLSIGILSYDNKVSLNFFNSFLKLLLFLQSNNINVNILTNSYQNSKGVSSTFLKNILVSQFLKEQTNEYLLFLNSNLEKLNNEDILEMIKLDKDIIGKDNLANAKSASLEANLENNTLENNTLENLNKENLNKENSSLFEEIDKLSSDLLLIKRSVFEKIINLTSIETYSYDSPSLDANNILYLLFESKIVDGEYLMEDYFFCRRWKDYGGKIFRLN
jgi:hypothetical protein